MDDSFASMLKTLNGRMRRNFSPFEMSRAIRNRIGRIVSPSVGEEKGRLRLHRDISTILNTIGSHLWRSKAISMGIRPYTAETVSALMQEFTVYAMFVKIVCVGDRLALSDSFITSADAAASHALVVDDPILATIVVSALSELQRSKLKLISGIDASSWDFSIDGFAVSDETRATALIDLIPIFQFADALTAFQTIELMERHLKLFPEQTLQTVITDLFGIPRFYSKCKISAIHDRNPSVGPRCSTAQLLLTRLIRVSQLFLKAEEIKGGAGITAKDVDDINNSKGVGILASSAFVSCSRLQKTTTFEHSDANVTAAVSEDVNVHVVLNSDESAITIFVKEIDVSQQFLNLIVIQLVLRVIRLELSRVYSTRQAAELSSKDFDITGLEKHLVKVSKLPASSNFEEYLHAVFDEAYDARVEIITLPHEPSRLVTPANDSEGWAAVAKLQESVENRRKLPYNPSKTTANDAGGFTSSFGGGGGGGVGGRGSGGGGTSSGSGGGEDSGGLGYDHGSSISGDDDNNRGANNNNSSDLGGGGAKHSAMSEIDDSTTMGEITFTEQEAVLKSLKESDDHGGDEEVPNLEGNNNNTLTGLIGERFALKFLRR